MIIKINKDPEEEYKNEFMRGYTFKEIICIVSALAIVVSITIFAYVKEGLNPQIGCYIGLPFALPVIFFGFAKFDGMTVFQLIHEMLYERKTKCLTYDADEVEEYTTPVTLVKSEMRKKK